MAKYNIAETFVSLNGEGPRTGQLAYFVRFAGCNLTCSFCDTTWANDTEKLEKFETMTEHQIYEGIRLSGVTNITITGGEPMLQPDISVLLELLVSDELLNIEIETNGSIDLQPFEKLQSSGRLNFTVDYKLPSSSMEIMMRVSNFDLLKKSETVKFVAGSISDLERAQTVIDAYNLSDKCNVLISPVYGELEPEKIADFIKEHKLNKTGLQIQLHKLLWGADARGV